MTTTRHRVADVVGAAIEAATAHIGDHLGASLVAGRPTKVAAAAVNGRRDAVVNRIDFNHGGVPAHLTVLVPAGGLPSAQINVDPASLLAAVTAGSVAGITQAGAAPIRPQAEQRLDSGPVAGPGDDVFEFTLRTADGAVATIHWVVAASLGSLLSGGDPVDPPAVQGPSAAAATLPELGGGGPTGQPRDLLVLREVPMRFSAEVGRASMLVHELLTLTSGKIIELDRGAGDPVDVKINGTFVGKGEIVVQGNTVAVRITEIVEPT
jgi:flagellar motor switch protein FliN/FliY